MSWCLGAQQANRRLDGVETDLTRLAHRLALLAGELGVNLDRVELVDRIERRDGVAVTFEEVEALRLHDHDGAP